MAAKRRREDEMAAVDTAGKHNIPEENATHPPESDSKLAVLQLRQRWELASVINFLNVFEPVIGSDLKISAEEIEIGLINPNSSLANLHVGLLKGIPPVMKTLNSTDSWVPALCKKLTMWWPWVAEGDIPFRWAKGEETSKYKELNPTTRLLMLKALCEIRVDQDDTASYLSDAHKSGTEISCYPKDKIGGDGNGTTYWSDGNEFMGYRLYKEVKKVVPASKLKRNNCTTTQPFTFQWETLATNLDEFQKVLAEFSYSKVWCEMAVGKTIEVEIIPVLEKLKKKNEEALKRKQRKEEMLLNSYQNSCVTGVTRSCRLRRPVSYTFDAYDRAINEAIHATKNKTVKDQKNEKLNKTEKHEIGQTSSASPESEASVEKQVSMDDGDDQSDGDYLEKEEDVDQNGDTQESESSDSEKENKNVGNLNPRHQQAKPHEVHNPKGLRWSSRIVENNNKHDEHKRDIISKNRSRVRPTRNTAIESKVVLDSEDEASEKEVMDELSENESISSDSDSERQNQISP